MDPFDYNSNNYKEQVINWAVRNPGALWQDTKEASDVRSWMEQNAPDDFASLYWNEDDISKIDSRFIPTKARERRMEDAVRSRDKAVPYIAGALAAPVVAGEAVMTLPHIGTGLDLLSTSKFGQGVAHGLNVLGNPTAAKTTAGAIGALGLDLSGLYAGLNGLSQDFTNIRNGNYSWNQVPQTLLNGMVMLPGSSVLTRPQNWSSAFNTSRGLYNNFRNTVNQFKDLKVDLDVTNLPLESTKPFPFTISDLPGYQLGMLMRGNPLEKQISSAGTINANNIKALINKASNVEKFIIEKVLSEQFPNQKSINYNQFRRAVQNELITYNKTINNMYDGYGANNLGYDISKTEYFKSGEVAPFNNGDYPATFNTYLFNSDRIPIGALEHFPEYNTLGHVRTMELKKEPHTLYVLESQSDWGQKPEMSKDLLKYGFSGERFAPSNYEFYKERSETNHNLRHVDERFRIYERLDNARAEGYKKALDDGIDVRDALNPNIEHLLKNFEKRQLQEIFKLAAENGKKSVRFPTGETITNIEGYLPEIENKDELLVDIKNLQERLKSEIDKLYELYAPETYIRPEDRESILFDLNFDYGRTVGSVNPEYDKSGQILVEKFGVKPNEKGQIDIRQFKQKLQKALEFSEKFDTSKEGIELENMIRDAEFAFNTNDYIYNNASNFGDYSPKHQAVIDKYEDLPKQLQKYFKDFQWRIITDPKGNTWYEVTVPENYLQQEWKYKSGGKLSNDPLSYNIEN